jgi:hypothetical protein
MPFTRASDFIHQDSQTTLSIKRGESGLQEKAAKESTGRFGREGEKKKVGEKKKSSKLKRSDSFTTKYNEINRAVMSEHSVSAAQHTWSAHLVGPRCMLV